MTDTTARPSLRQAVNLHCRACIYDPSPVVRGTWREQVAACTSSNCALFDVRPVPRPCQTEGIIDTAAVEAIRFRLNGRNTGEAL